MFEKVEIIYDFNGYADPKIKKVEVARVDGYKTIIKKEGDNKMTDNEKKFSEAEARVNIYQKEHPGISYREAVLKCGLKSSEEERLVSKDFSELTKDEVLRAKKLIDDVIYNLSLAKTSKSFPESEQNKLDQAYELVKEVSKSMEILVEKNK